MISNRVGPLYIYGPIGTGKTTLAKRLHQQLEQQPERYVVASLVVPPQLRVNALLRLMMEDFSVRTVRSYAGCLQSFAAWLIEQHQIGVKPVMIVDEAQNLTPHHLKLLHFLLNYETSREKLLQIVLYGQNELAQRIERLPELKSRMYPAALTALNRGDTEALIAFRWYVAGGGQRPPFAGKAIDEVFRVTLGLPREIVKVCDLALAHTFSAHRDGVTLADVAAAARELDLVSEGATDGNV